MDDCVTFFGLVRLADLVGQLQSARGQFAELAVARERLRTAEDLQAAVGERLADAATIIAAAQHAMPGNPAEARARIEAAGVTARDAIAQARAVTTGHCRPTGPGPPPGRLPGRRGGGRAAAGLGPRGRAVVRVRAADPE